MYSFVSPMLIGAAFTDSDNSKLYNDLGIIIGQAFQIQDDLLDIIGDSKKTGKLVFNDIQQGQHTLLTQYVFEHGEDYDKEILRTLFGKTLDEHSRKVLLHMFTSTGSITYAQTEINFLIKKAEDCIEKSNLKNDYKKKWIEFILLLKNRVS